MPVTRRLSPCCWSGAAYGGQGRAVPADVVLLMRAEHERLLALASLWASDVGQPAGALRQALRAHVGAVSAEVAPLLRTVPSPAAVRSWLRDLERTGTLVVEGGEQVVADVARRMVQVEEGCVLPLLGRALPVQARREMGDRYRAVRDAPSGP
jgi:hypothetical protein